MRARKSAAGREAVLWTDVPLVTNRRCGHRPAGPSHRKPSRINYLQYAMQDRLRHLGWRAIDVEWHSRPLTGSRSPTKFQAGRNICG